MRVVRETILEIFDAKEARVPYGFRDSSDDGGAVGVFEILFHAARRRGGGGRGVGGGGEGDDDHNEFQE